MNLPATNTIELHCNGYQAFTATTALYPLHVEREYLTLGLCSEAGEIAMFCLEDGEPLDVRACVNEIIKELGDCTWYAARLAAHYQWPFYDLCHAAFRGAQTQMELEGVPHDLENLVLLLCGSAGTAAGVIKKQQRDGATWSGEKRQEMADKLKMALIDHLQAVTLLTYALQPVSNDELSFALVLDRNIEKLKGRQERGTLQGSGDSR